MEIVGDKKSTIQAIADEMKVLAEDEQDEMLCGVCMYYSRGLHIPRSRTRKAAAKEAYEEEGWREAIHKASATQGLFCGHCVANED